jgi:hypothetical protein
MTKDKMLAVIRLFNEDSSRPAEETLAGLIEAREEVVGMIDAIEEDLTSADEDEEG